MEALQKLEVDSPLVELYVLDLVPLGGTVFRFTPHFAEGGSVAFAGSTYFSIPITSEGWEVTATGTQPRPTLTLSNVNKVMLDAVVSFGDIVGAKVTRLRTLGKYLDGGSNPDPNQFLEPDVFFVEQKVAHDKNAISWQLSSVIDKFGIKLPRRQVTKDYFPGISSSRGRW